uniref:Liver-expressed antimicrobial peptide 2 n=1 Tax=Canis lupus familiaris TaxID=9615 RepID=A0A8C0RZD1_CANLF
MWHLKLFAVLMICLLLLNQVDGSPIMELSSTKRRPRRMTPFWRGVSLRPIGSSCRDDSECITRLCRYSTNLRAGQRKEQHTHRPKNKTGLAIAWALVGSSMANPPGLQNQEQLHTDTTRMVLFLSAVCPEAG